MTAKSLGWESVGGHPFFSCHSGIAKLDAALTGNENIYMLSDFAEALLDLRSRGELPKYKAALDICENPDFEECMSLANRLSEYEFNPEIVVAADYGEMEMLRLHKLDRSCPGMDHFDFAAFGSALLAQNGARITPYGMICKTDSEQVLGVGVEGDLTHGVVMM